ncbi:SIR2 family protein [Rhizobium leguminosarum]|uniref:SIR2 family protein n=1 Tax=Rhizobium leguminosarum TaxID=384 RepID=UPI001C91F896|nr:SIR2 family protein [Rhizobium leguminosarum]MBY2949192.1 Sir2 family NAD-dependent protein deacetylase [Rhizobium leguminosarum]
MQYQEAIRSLTDAVARRQAILFVGAGVSMSVGLPSWESLIAHIQSDLGIDCSTNDCHRSSYQEIAEFYRLKHGSICPLVEWMSQEWRVDPDCLRKSHLHRLIVDADFPFIYTTNYDANLEAAYEAFGKPYVKITGAADLAAALPGLTQIIKFHGDFSNPEGLVITESDYFDRLSFDAPMDIKFRGDAFASTLLFVGYSMTDLNIRFLLHRLWKTWRDTGQERARPPLYIVMHDADDVQKHVLDRWGVTVIEGRGGNAEESLLLFLQELKNSLAAQRASCGSADVLTFSRASRQTKSDKLVSDEPRSCSTTASSLQGTSVAAFDEASKT